MIGDLLWVYEGLTQYLGDMLAARIGLWTPEQYREALAATAAEMDHRPGRTWRSVEDTTRSVQALRMLGSQWSSWRRGLDYYPEGELIWLEVDATIRQQTRGQRSLNDFCPLFHGGESGPPKVVPYTFDDVVLALLEEADEVLLIASLDIPSIKNLKVGIQTLDLLSVAGSKLHLVMNRAERCIEPPRKVCQGVLLFRPEQQRGKDVSL